MAISHPKSSYFRACNFNSSYSVFTEQRKWIVYSVCFIKAINLPENNLDFPCERQGHPTGTDAHIEHIPLMQLYFRMFGPEFPSWNILYLETFSAAIKHHFTPIKFRRDEYLSLQNHIHNTHPWSLCLALDFKYTMSTRTHHIVSANLSYHASSP